MCTLSVSNVIYHKFSHGAAFYTLNGKNVNIMLELEIYIENIVAKKGATSPLIHKILLPDVDFYV